MFYNGDLVCKSIKHIVCNNYKTGLTKLYSLKNWAQVLNKNSLRAFNI